MRSAYALLIIGLTTLIAACGSSGDGGTVGDVTKCGGKGEASVEIDGDALPVLFGSNVPSGSILVQIISGEDLPDVIADSAFPGESFTARGNFVGVRYSLTNGLQEEMQLSTQFHDDLRITDGKQSWAVADYNDDHFGAPGWSWAEQYGDVGGATYVGAGFSETTWAVYDLPAGVTPTGLGFQLPNGRAICFALGEIS